jgi:hypothetical protein
MEIEELIATLKGRSATEIMALIAESQHAESVADPAVLAAYLHKKATES